MENTTLPIIKKAVRSDDPLRATINKHFLIRWRIENVKGTHLVSAGKYETIIADHIDTDPTEEKIDHFTRALKSKKQKYPIKRGRLFITFVSK